MPDRIRLTEPFRALRMKPRQDPNRLWLLPTDFLMLLSAAATTYYLRFQTGIFGIRPVFFSVSLEEYWMTALVIIVGLVLIFGFAGLYNARVFRHTTEEIRTVMLSVTAGTMAMIMLVFLQRDLFSSRFVIVTAWLTSIFFVIFGRIILRTVRVAFARRGIGLVPLALVGETSAGTILKTMISHGAMPGYRIIETIPGTGEGGQRWDERVHELVEQHLVSEIILTDATLDPILVTNVMQICEEHGVTFRYIPSTFQMMNTNLSVETIGGIPVVEVRNSALTGFGLVMKRLVDIVGSLFAIILLSPIMITIAIAIKATSPGPILFSRNPKTKGPYQRIGKEGKPFHYFKFRSMIDNAHLAKYDAAFMSSMDNLREGTPLTKFKEDPRITKIGKLLRRTSLDELPEFFLVLMGRMSLVGPRPHEPEEVSKYAAHHRAVLRVKPGITGLPQISGRSDLDFEDEVRLDNWYIENWSLWQDVVILLKTLGAILRRRKAL